VKSIYNDGWAYGRNFETGCEGMFPMVFLESLEEHGSGELALAPDHVINLVTRKDKVSETDLTDSQMMAQLGM
jgi:hypothetical protein